MKYSLLIALLLLAAPLQAATLNNAPVLDDQQPADEIAQPAPVYETTIEDIPLMPGLHPAPQEETIRLTTPKGGRVTHAVTEGTVDVDQLYVWYRAQLPELGWVKTGPRNFTKNGDNLLIEAHGDGKLTTVTFDINPPARAM